MSVQRAWRARTRARLAETLAVGAAEAWQRDALCAETDPELFYPESGGPVVDAKRVCGACGVRAECLTYALEHKERYGVWGGMSERQRRKLLKKHVDGQGEFDDVEAPTPWKLPTTGRCTSRQAATALGIPIDRNTTKTLRGLGLMSRTDRAGFCSWDCEQVRATVLREARPGQRICPECDVKFPAKTSRVYCTPACSQAADRRRRQDKRAEQAEVA